MNPVKKALWRIESGMEEELTLDSIAAHAGVSRFYLARAFAASTGFPVMGYLRARRLTKAARALADGAGDILSVALDSGYGSHEAFTRAFRERFGQTPESVREGRSLAHLPLVEALPMHDTQKLDLKPPRIVDHEAILLAGLSDRFHCDNKQNIPALWMRFGPKIETIGDRPSVLDAFGAVTNTDDAGNFDYYAAVAVRSFADTPGEFAHLRVPAARYAIFRHDGHISEIAGVMDAVWAWAPDSGHEPADATFLEYYPETFDPMSGMGGFEIWFPIKG